MTAAVKDELARFSVTKTCCRRAEVCALLRFASGLRIRDGRVVVQVELDTGERAWDEHRPHQPRQLPRDQDRAGGRRTRPRLRRRRQCRKLLGV
jgi:hypothetical protein